MGSMSDTSNNDFPTEAMTEEKEGILDEVPQVVRTAIESLKKMIQLDDTIQYLEAPQGQPYHPDDDNAVWLEVLYQAQKAIFDISGEMIPNDMGVLLLP
jgi:hypothetical protein